MSRKSVLFGLGALSLVVWLSFSFAVEVPEEPIEIEVSDFVFESNPEKVVSAYEADVDIQTRLNAAIKE